DLEAIGGSAYLATLLEEATTPAQFSYYARLVRGHARKRAEIRLGHDLIERGYDGSPIAEDLAFLDRERGALAAERNGGSQAQTGWALAMPAPTFLAAIENDCDFLEDRILAPGSVTEFFSPRGLGKTHVAHALAVRLARAGKRVLFLDRDNSRRELRRRF